MSDAVDGLIEERRALDRGFGRGLVGSVLGHALLAGAVLTAGWWMPSGPMIRVADGLVIPLPPGGGGSSNPAPAPAGPPATSVAKPPTTEAPAPVQPKVVKPPKEETNPNRIPELDSKKKPPKTGPSPAAARGALTPKAERDAREARGKTGGANGPGGTGIGGTGKGTNSQYPGLDLMGPEGPGVPGGTDMSGDWYLAGVQRKIWLLWNQQIKPGFAQPIGVSFTILADGSVADVRVIQPSGISQLDFAAQRAVMAAAPFSPLPKDYGTNRFTIQALFKPTT